MYLGYKHLVGRRDECSSERLPCTDMYETGRARFPPTRYPIMWRIIGEMIVLKRKRKDDHERREPSENK